MSSAPSTPPAAAPAPQRTILVRTFPRAAVETLVAQLVASGAAEAPSIPTGAP